MNKIIKFLFVCIIIILVCCYCNDVDNSNQEEISAQKIESICENHGQNIRLISTNDYGNAKYVSSIYGINLDGSDFYMQISLNYAYKSAGNVAIGAFRELKDCKDIENDFEQYYNLVSDIVNYYGNQNITAEQIESFYKDNTNITKNNYPKVSDGLFYVIEKTQNLSDKCWIRYQITTFMNEEGNGAEPNSIFEEEWIIECNN